MPTDRLELVRLRKDSCGCRGPCDDCMLFSLLAAEVRELRKDRERLDAILARRIATVWDDELGYSVKLENREMVDAWLEDIDAALSARSGEGE